MKFELRPARRGAIYGRVLMFGESGQGKTYSALAVAFHLVELYGFDPSEIGVLDTEHVESADHSEGGTGSAEKYEGRPCNCNRCQRQGLVFNGFQTMLMEPGSRDVDSFCRALQVCKQSGIKIVLLDGITDQWRALLDLTSQIKARSGGKDDGWGTARPLHKQFVRAIMDYPGHVIATCRAKKESRHKKADEGMGDVLPDQDGNVIYEYDVAVFFKRGTGYVVKTRDDRLEGVSSRHPGADLAEGLKRWCDDPKAKTASASAASAIANPANPLPGTAPNTRTDVAPAPTAQDRCAHENVYARVCQACGATVNEPDSPGGAQPASAAMLTEVAGHVETLRKLGLTAIADQSDAYAEEHQGNAEKIADLLLRQKLVLEKEDERLVAEAAEAARLDREAEAEKVGAGATEGYEDLPF